MENIDKIKCILIDFEIADKTLDEAANEILLLFSVSGSVCDECIDGSGWYGDEDITYNCSKCNPEAN
jgi:hypothetical protein